MYSYEDRIRAVKLYIKLGNGLGATIQRLGYPTKNSLKGNHLLKVWSILKIRGDSLEGTTSNLRICRRLDVCGCTV